MTSVDRLRCRPRRSWLFVRVFLLLVPVAVSGNSLAGEVKLAWDAVADATGYRLYYGTSSGGYFSSIDVQNSTSVTVPGLTDGARYFFALKAYNSTPTSDCSNEVSAGTAASAPGVTVAPPVSDGGTTPPPPLASGGSTTNSPSTPSASGGSTTMSTPTATPTPVGTVTPARSNDLDGDTRRDIVVFRPSTGMWFVRYSSSAIAAGTYQWGLPGDIPLSGDFDGDGKMDLTVWRPSNGTWYILYSTLGYDQTSPGAFQWGLPGDIPLAGDFDGDGASDMAIWRPSNGTWYIRYSSGS